MTRINIGVFEMLNPNNGLPTWSHPQAKAHTWDRLDYWTGLARTLDEAGFDFLFFADTYGYASIGGEVPEEVITHGIQFPGLDPMLLISALAQQTSQLGFVITSPTTVEHPYATARRFASLDHFTSGRIGWNVVTGSSQVTTDRLFGREGRDVGHDERYERADEFVELCLKLWETSWEDDADLRDTTRGLYADPAKVHEIDHAGRFYSSRGRFAVAPGPQRTPVLFQAGTSSRGRAFAARRAEAVFIQGQTPEQAAKQVRALRAAARDVGRRPQDLRIISGTTVVLGDTEEQAHARRAEMEELYTRDDAAVLFAGIAGVDLRGADPQAPVTAAVAAGLSTQQGQTLIDRYVRPGQPVPTIGEVLDRFRVQALRGFQLTGTAEQVAGQLASLVERTGLDGFMLEPTFGGAQVFEEFAATVMPLLRERGLVPPAPAEAGGTLRERITGAGPRLSAAHVPARTRRPERE